MKKLLISTILAVAAAFSFTGCYDAIFQSIRNEVELEDGTISGFGNNIVRFDNGTNKYLFTSNGTIYYKDASKSEHGAWKEVSGNGLPATMTYSYWSSEFSGLHYYKMAADETNVYVLGYEMEYDEDNSRNVPSKIELYYSTPSVADDGTLNFTWTRNDTVSDEINSYLADLIKLDDENYGMDSSVHLFCTNAYTASHRSAYIRIGGGSSYLKSTRNDTWVVYKLNGSEVSKVQTSDFDGNSEITRYVLSAVYYNSAVHFLSYLNADTNEGTLNSAGEKRTDPTYVYFGDYGEVLSSFSVEAAVTGASEDAVEVFKDGTTSGDTVSVTPFQAFCSKLYRADTSKLTAPESGIIVCTDMDTTASIISLAVTNNSLILGTGYNRSYGSSSGSGYGAYHVEVDADGKPATETSDFSTNADTVMCNPYHVRALLCSTPDKNETDADIYSTLDYIYTESSSGTSISNRGLWAYYPSRGNWNRE